MTTLFWLDFPNYISSFPLSRDRSHCERSQRTICNPRSAQTLRPYASSGLLSSETAAAALDSAASVVAGASSAEASVAVPDSSAAAAASGSDAGAAAGAATASAAGSAAPSATGAATASAAGSAATSATGCGLRRGDWSGLRSRLGGDFSDRLGCLLCLRRGCFFHDSRRRRLVFHQTAYRL